MRKNAGLWKEYIGITAGVVFTALALDLFLIPHKIAAGGVSGLATVIFHVWGLPVGMTMLALNIPIFVVGIRVLGGGFGAKSFYGLVLLSLMIDILATLTHPLTQDTLIASVYGGVLAGVGIGITFRFGGSTGGTDMAARLLHHVTGLSAGIALLFVDGAVIVAAGFVFGPEHALIALLAVFLTTKTIDVVQEGTDYAKAAFVISSESETIGQLIMEELDRGVTVFPGKGLFTGQNKDILFVVVARVQLSALKQIVRQVDTKAFVVISDVREVLGEGFVEVEGKS